MKVILLRNVKNLGSFSEVVTVKRGYFLHYLHPNKYAVIFSEDNMSFFNENKKRIEEANRSYMRQEELIQEVVNGKDVFLLCQRVNEIGHLYGSITPKKISSLLKENYDVDVQPEDVRVPHVIKKLGTYTIKIDFHMKSACCFNLHVVSSLDKTDKKISDEIADNAS